ncbi:hypothetical protein SI859A1_03467 [Aurantimonas manganoxydans SI85-9A1]|uniref:Uncharacterized protein n=1 Tax=Aurantimonas manganoxydans (strain ATCC BAA-1229 / DSM 21871 / SI85-9A1) TaxID=287752 RepID=Q1YER6_AURMS|nr:hypothetical protein SI859A1_03467 [Aurantimonas manganoxydans SI85-9A1]
MHKLSSRMTKRAVWTVPTLSRPAKISSAFWAMAITALARPREDVSASGMTRFIMRCTFSLGWVDGRGPPGSFGLGSSQFQYGTTTCVARNLNQAFSGRASTYRPKRLSSDIPSPPRKWTRRAAAARARNLVGLFAHAQDWVVGRLHAVDEKPGIEAQSLARLGLIVGDGLDSHRAHDDAHAVGRPRPRRVIEGVARLADRHHE